jgi:hypothetical protein
MQRIFFKDLPAKTTRELLELYRNQMRWVTGVLYLQSTVTWKVTFYMTVALVNFRFWQLGLCFMKLGDYLDAPLIIILHFIQSVRRGCTTDHRRSQCKGQFGSQLIR